MISPKPNATLTVTVTGAAGQIAYSLLPLLANGSIFGRKQKIELRLLEITPALKALNGVIMELEDGAYPLLTSAIETDDPLCAFKDADVAILVGAFPRKPGMERKDLLARNVLIFRAQGKAIANAASKKIKVVVVGNPANTNALVLNRFTEGIPSRNITALTRLDHNRTVSQIAKHLGASVADVRGVCIWGNHSSTQYPDVTHATVNNLPVIGKLGGLQSIAEKLIPVIQKRGAAIINARGLSSAMSAANAIGDHLRSWLCGDSRIVSMAVLSDGSYGIKQGLYFSFPVRCSGNGEYEIVSDLKMDSFSTKYINATEAELMAEREEAIDILR